MGGPGPGQGWGFLGSAHLQPGPQRGDKLRAAAGAEFGRTDWSGPGADAEVCVQVAAKPEPGHLAASWRPPWPLPIGAAGGWPARRCWKTSSSRQSSWAGARCSSCSSQRAFTPTCVLSQVRGRVGLGWGGSWGGGFWIGRDGGTDLASNTTSPRSASGLAKGLLDPHPALPGTYHCSRFMDEETEAQTDLLTCPRNCNRIRTPKSGVLFPPPGNIVGHLSSQGLGHHLPCIKHDIL